ncbi:histidine phosphatase family protein [Desulfobotulus sp.]|uniref:histidine phosphatase family protein n=1 Tax=Desulfobotulus sp. TaxID=1940337 RepID=UPI002A3694E9|nr:histidine phosphatase family protein [Desulfobotulus sp.]MDY0164251.1 histidine phosphatase family protein [Desulfobotulus sp.]
MYRVIRSMFLCFVLMLLPACSGDSNSNSLLSVDNVNLIFVVSPDMANNTPGDMNPDTASLSNQGLQRSLMMATYLKQQVLGGENVSSIYTISPMSHLQTRDNYPDMAAIGFIQQFALLNQMSSSIDANGNLYTGNSYPINVSYAEGGVPVGVAEPAPPLPGSPQYCPDCTGLDFGNAGGNNETLVSTIIENQIPGYYIFSAPWETTEALLKYINTQYGFRLTLPTVYMGTDYLYAISIPSSGKARLVTYNANLNPPTTYPVLPYPVKSSVCTNRFQPPFSTTRVGGVNGVIIPSGINTNSRIYIVRHAEAHPDPGFKFENGNYVAAGQWRALMLAHILRDKIISPDVVYSIDPAGTWYPTRDGNVSYVRPSLTVLPYAIANNLPYYLAADLSLGSAFTPTDENIAQKTSDYFFTGGKFSNQTVLLAWESGHIKPFIKKLIDSYGGDYQPLPEDWTDWPSEDYDTIWSVALDGQGNVSIDNLLCEGIDSENLPTTVPLF